MGAMSIAFWSNPTCLLFLPVSRCTPGYTGVQCEDKCSEGRWGSSCTETCSCPKVVVVYCLKYYKCITSVTTPAQREQLATTSLGSASHVPLACGEKAARRNAGEKKAKSFVLNSVQCSRKYRIKDYYLSKVAMCCRCEEEGTELCGHTDGRCFCKGNRFGLRSCKCFHFV